MRSTSEEAFLRLFKYYHRFSRDSVEGELPRDNADEMLSMVRRCSASDPDAFAPLFEKIVRSDEISNDYATSIMEGLIRHVVCRLSHPGECMSDSPLPDRVRRVRILLDWLARHRFLWEKSGEIAAMVNACADIPKELEDIEAFIFCLFRLADHPDPEEAEPDTLTSEGLHDASSHSIRGKTAETALLLASSLLKRKRRVHPLLSSLLLRFATDGHPGVRASLLKHLPAFARYDSEGAWRLCRAAFQLPHPLLWDHGEPFLSDQCDKNFKQVRHYVERIRNEAFDTAAEVWGKVSAMACLSGHIEADRLSDDLLFLKNEDAWRGVDEAFKERITRADTLHAALLTATQYISFVHEMEKIRQPEWFHEWLSQLSVSAPLSAIQIRENLAR